MKWCEQEVSDQKNIVYLRKQVELNHVILLKVKRVCRLDQNMVTMALRRVFYSLSLSTLTHGMQASMLKSIRILRLLAINIEYTFKVCFFSC